MRRGNGDGTSIITISIFIKNNAGARILIAKATATVPAAQGPPIAHDDDVSRTASLGPVRELNGEAAHAAGGGGGGGAGGPTPTK